MDAYTRPRRTLTKKNYHVPDEDPLEWDDVQSRVVRSVHDSKDDPAKPVLDPVQVEEKSMTIQSVVRILDDSDDNSGDDSDLDTLQSDERSVYDFDFGLDPVQFSDGDDSCFGDLQNDERSVHDSEFGLDPVQIKEKLRQWGAFEKDWTKITDLERHLRAQPEKGITYLKGLVEILHHGISIEDFEKRIPPAEVTHFYWSTKNDLERLAGKKVMLLIGFCPQYNVTLEGNSAEIAPGDSRCLTQLIQSWLARQSNGLLLSWDFRHDCRKKSKPINPNSDYAMCAPVDNLKTETEQLKYLSYILVLVAQKLYSIKIQGTISFSVCTNEFVKLLDVPHITLGEHISRICKKHILAVILVKRMVDSRLYGDQRWEDLYKTLAEHLALGPGKESGKALVRLPSIEEESESGGPIIFKEYISSSTEARKEYGRNASAISRQRTKEREANDPEYAKKRSDAVRGYKEKDYAKVKTMRKEDPKAYRVRREHINETQRKRRAKQPGYSKAYNEKVKQKRLDDPEFDKMYTERKKRIDKKCKDKKRGKN